MTEKTKKKCTAKTEVFSRVTGFYRPVQQWNKGKRQEYNDRTVYTPLNTSSKKNIAC